ncbi:DUF4240 domain-containing protein [Chitinophaga sp. CC14]|uniref:DUF4240 domain-containing protein n=1 Tax=Chitinophaga sp. CC14 TaxID=3029199 RepID=UPI003B80364C
MDYGNFNIPGLVATAKLMDEDLYWRIVAASLNTTSTLRKQEIFLTETLKELSATQVISFMLRTEKLLYDSYTSTLWCAGIIMNRGFCSDDGFRYFRCWIISRGRKVFYNAIGNPDSLIDQINPRLKHYDFESFSYIPSRAFEDMTQKEIYNYIDSNFLYNEGRYKKFKFSWSADQPETLRQICPSLFAKFLS